MKQLMVLLLFTLGVLQAEGTDENCKLKADVVFVVDSSRSIWEPHYDLQLDFLANLTRHMNVARDGTHVGAVSFSRGSRLEFYPSDFTDVQELQNTIRAIPFMSGDTTETFKGLKLARTMLADVSRGARKDVPHIIIIVTDGNPSNRTATKAQADIARQDNVKVFAVGIGHSVDYSQLAEMATQDSETYVHTVTSFSALKGLRQVLIPAACNAATTTAPEVTTPSSGGEQTTEVAINDSAEKLCTKKKADVVFVLDKSSSIKADNFKKQLNFVNDVIGIFSVSKNHTHVSVVTFDYEPRVEFGLNEYFTTSQMRQAVAKIKYTAGSTNTHLALEQVATEVLTPERGARAGIARVVIVVTDGKSSDEEKTQFWAQVLKKKFGAYVFAIGVGTEADHKELVAMASKNASKYVFQVRNGYNALATIKTILATRACEVPSGDIFVRCQQNAIPSDVMFVTHFAHAVLNDVKGTTEMIRSVAGGIMTSSGKVNVGVSTSDCAKVTNVKLGKAKTPKLFAQAVKIRNSGGLAPALAKARKQMSRRKQRVMVVTVHGPISDLKQAQREIRRAEFMGIKVVLVGRDRAVKGELMNLVNQRRGSDVRVLMEGLARSTPFWQSVLARVCEELSPGQQFD